MFLEIFSICDAATDYGGRLNLLGAFEGIAAPTAPIVRGRCSIAIRVRFKPEEAGAHAVAVRIVDGEGTAVLPDMEAALNVKVPNGRPSAAVNLVLNVNRMQFPKFGIFRIQLLVGGEQRGELPLIVAQTKARNRLKNSMEN